MSEPQFAAPAHQNFDSFQEFYLNSVYSKFPQEHRAAGSLGMALLSVEQDPIDLIDNPVPDLTIILSYEKHAEVALDAGDGLRVQRRIPAGAVTVTPPMTAQRFRIRDPHRLTVVGLRGATTARLLAAHGLDQEAWARFVAEMHHRPDIARTIRSLWALSAGGAPQDGLRVDALTLQLLAQLCDGPALSPVLDDRTDARITRVIEYVEAQLSTQLSVTELAAIAAMSPAHFSRCFKATVGEPVWTYVQRRRCERAKEALLHSTAPLAEIAYAAGFASQAHMTTSLKERYGATPRAIRRDRA